MKYWKVSIRDYDPSPYVIHVVAENQKLAKELAERLYGIGSLTSDPEQDFNYNIA